MSQYMVELALPVSFDEEFIALIPSQRERVSKLMAERKMVSYALDEDRTKIWAVIIANSETEVRQILATFPLRKYMRASIKKLAFNENNQLAFPQISLN